MNTPNLPGNRPNPQVNLPPQFAKMNEVARAFWLRLWAWYRARSKRMQVILGAVVLIFTCCTCSLPFTGNAATTPQHVAYNPTLTATPVGYVAPTKTPLPSTATSIPPTATAVPPTSTPARTDLFLDFTLASAGYVSVHTQPGAQLTIKVLYLCSGSYATSKDLQGTVTADIAGDYGWSWSVGTKCSGQAKATVTANWNGKSITNEATFQAN